MLLTKYSGDQIKKNEMSGACSMRERVGAYRVLAEKPEGWRLRGRRRRRWEDYVEMDVQEVGWGVDWINLAQGKDR